MKKIKTLEKMSYVDAKNKYQKMHPFSFPITFANKIKTVNPNITGRNNNIENQKKEIPINNHIQNTNNTNKSKYNTHTTTNVAPNVSPNLHRYV